MKYIVDIQGFTGACNEFIAKEFAVISLDGGAIEHFLIKPPYEWRELPRKNKNEARWLLRNYHDFHWSDGLIEYDDFIHYIPKLMRYATTVYVKGERKRKFLAQYLPVENIVDLTDMPSLRSEYFNMQYTKRCMFHIFSVKMCALRNVHKIKMFLNK